MQIAAGVMGTLITDHVTYLASDWLLMPSAASCTKHRENRHCVCINGET